MGQGMQNADRGFTGEERNMANRFAHTGLRENEEKQACWAEREKAWGRLCWAKLFMGQGK